MVWLRDVHSGHDERRWESGFDESAFIHGACQRAPCTVRWTVGPGTRTMTTHAGPLGGRRRRLRVRLFSIPNQGIRQEESWKGRRPGCSIGERVNGCIPAMFECLSCTFQRDYSPPLRWIGRRRRLQRTCEVLGCNWAVCPIALPGDTRFSQYPGGA
jgi:hypothetical protein